MRADSQSPVSGQLAVVVGNVVPLHSKADPDSELATQALIGQSVIAEGGQAEWLFVQTWDTYRGWIGSTNVRAVEDGSMPYASRGAVAVIRELFVDILESPSERAAIITKATISAELEVANSQRDWVEVALPDGRAGFIRKHEARLVDKDVAQTIWLPDPSKLIETAGRFIGVPYLWGGASPFGLDCSGFVQLVHRVHGVTLLRDAALQADDPRGASVETNQLRAGYLVFFGDGRVTHVGLALGSDRFIHACASSGVTITPFDDPYYAKIYQGAKRMRLATLDPGGGAPED